MSEPLMLSEPLMSWQKALGKEVERSHKQVCAGGNSRGILLLGPSGSGKTHAFDAIAAAYPSSVKGVQRLTPCVRISMKAKPDVKAMSRSFLMQLGRPVRESATIGEDTVQAAFRERETRIVLMEEVHNNLLSSERRMAKQSGDFIKNMWNSAPNDTSQGWAGPASSDARHSIVIVVSAIEELRRAIDRDDELRSRFGTVIVAPRLALYPPELLRQFRLVLRSMVRRFELTGFVDTDNAVLAVRLLLACGAHLRTLEDILSRVKLLRDEGDTRPALELLKDAMSVVATTLFESGNPFTLSEDELATKVAQAKKDYERQEQLLRGRGVRA